MTRRYLLLTISMTLALTWAAGCSSLPNFMKPSSSSSTSNSKTTSPGLYSSVPASMRAPVNEASSELKRSESNLKLAEEKVKLAELKKERAIVEKKNADLNAKLAETVVKKAQVSVERKKVEAIDNANLGDRATNIKKIASYKTKELNIESNIVETKADIATLDLEIKRLNKRINLQARKVESIR